MSRLLHFTYDIRLTFSCPVVQHAFVLRCLPPDLPGQQVLDAGLTLDPSAPFSIQRDSFGNLLEIGQLEEPHDHFWYTARGSVRVDFEQRQLVRCSPIFRLSSFYTRLSPELAEWLASLSLPRNPRDLAWALAQAVHDRLDYATGSTGVATTAAQAFHAGKGVCQDFAHIYLALARQAALQAVTAIVVGSGIYVAFGVRDSILAYQRNEEAVPALLQLLEWQLENLRYTWFFPLLLLGEFLLVVGLYLAAKGGLYKLNLMEMLSQER